MNALAKRSGLGSDALGRHARNHLPAQLRAKLVAGPSLEGVDLDKLRETESQSLLLHLVALRNRLFAAMDTMEEFGDAHGLATISSQLHRNYEITGKLLGDLGVGGTTHINVTLLPSYAELRGALIAALRPYSDAAQAVAAVLHRLEDKAAEVVRADTRRLAGAPPVTIEAKPAVLPPPPC